MESIKDTKDYEKHYNESSFWNKVASYAKKAGTKLIYIALLLYYTLKSSNVSLKDKAIISGALGYFILPIDIIPDYIPIIGYTDDLSILIYAYKKVKSNIDDTIREKAKAKLNSFFGSYNKAEIEGY